MLTYIVAQNNDILRFRDQELIYDNGLHLARIGQADASEKKIMVVLADSTARDSKTVRIATMIAMLYLPANLVMVCFFQPQVLLFVLVGAFSSKYLTHCR